MSTVAKKKKEKRDVEGDSFANHNKWKYDTYIELPPKYTVVFQGHTVIS